MKPIKMHPMVALGWFGVAAGMTVMWYRAGVARGRSDVTFELLERTRAQLQAQLQAQQQI